MCLFKILFLSVQDHQEFHNVQDSVMKKGLMKLPFKSIYQLYFIQSFLIAIHGATPSLASNLLQRYILQNSSNVAQAQIKFFKLPLAIDSTFRFLAFSYGVILFFLNYFSILSTLHTTHDEGIGLVAEVLRNTVCGRWLLPGFSGMSYGGIPAYFTHLSGFCTVLTALVKWILLFSFVLWDDMQNIWKMCRKTFHNRQFHPYSPLRSRTESHPIFYMSEIISILFFKMAARSQWEAGAETWNRRECSTCRNLFSEIND